MKWIGLFVALVLLFIVLALAGCATYEPLPASLVPMRAPDEVSPIMSPVQQTAMLALRMNPLSTVVPDVDTNNYVTVPLAWNYLDPFPGYEFIICYGTNSGGPWPNEWAVGTNYTVSGWTNYFSLTFTNWNEAELKHYFIARVRRPPAPDSLPSNEVFWPLLPPDRVFISWVTNAPTMILSTADLTMPRASWLVETNVTGTNVVILMRDQWRFFISNRGETNRIRTFNPANFTSTGPLQLSP